MSNAIETSYYRLSDGRPARAQILPDDSSTDSPRVDECNGTVMITFGREYHSPDQISDVPDPLESIVRQWAGNGWRSSRGIRVDLVRRWAPIFAPDEVLYVGALWRGHSGGLMMGEPTEGQENEGIIMVTRETVRETHGEHLPTREQARLMAEQEVRRYTAWAEGEVYGYVVEVPAFPGADIDHDPEVLDSCWGYIGHEELPYVRELITDAIGEYNGASIDEVTFDEIMDVANGRHREALRDLSWN